MPFSNKKVEFNIDDNGCFICASHSKNKWGNSQIKIKGKNMLMHRFIYEQCFGEIPDGLILRHKCDTPSCINPEHLEIGTHQDNVNDKMSRGRHKNGILKGETNHQSVLTEDDIRLIRNDNHSTNIELGKIYGVSHSNISAIRLYKTWKHVI